MIMDESTKVDYFLPKNWPILASHLPHLCNVTPLYLELPLGNPVLCLRNTCTNSSFVNACICSIQHYNDKIICTRIICFPVQILSIKSEINTCFKSSSQSPRPKLMSASMPRNLIAALSYALEMVSKILIPHCCVRK